MEQWKQNTRRDTVIIDFDTLVPKEHLLRKIEKVMDYDWLYERLDPLYRHDNGRSGTDPVVLVSSTCSEFRLCARLTERFR